MTGCGGSPASTPPATVAPAAATPGAWTTVVNPFSVTDTAGRALDLAFLGGFNIPRPQLADLNGDGKLDLTLQEYTDRMVVLLRDGDGADGLPKWRFSTWQFAGVNVGEWSRFVDLDSDGKLDLLGELPYSYLRLWRNEGTTPSPVFTATRDTLRDTEGRAVFSDRQNIPQIVDIDCDGQVDLMIGRITGVILQYQLASGTAMPPVFRLITERFQDLEIVTGQGSMHGANTMAFADADGDGDQDLFWGDFFEAGLLWFENTGTCRQPHLRKDLVRFPPEDPVISSGYNAPAFGDLDGDGKLDLVVGSLGGSYDPIRTTIQNLFYYTRDAAGKFVRRTNQLLPMIDVGAESVPAIVDLDGDGDLDLLLANKIDIGERRTAKIYWYENTGGARAPSYRMRGALPITGRYHWAPAVGDLDGDGHDDLLLGNFGASLLWYRGNGTPAGFTLADSALVTITRGSQTVPALGDVDGDGDLDLMIGEASGVLNFYRNDGTRTAPKFTLVSDEFEKIDVGRRSAPAFADFDGDGDLDLLIGSDDQGLLLYRNEGTKTEPRWVHDPSFHAGMLPPTVAPAVGDLDGDGKLEVLVGNSGGGVVLLVASRESRVAR